MISSILTAGLALAVGVAAQTWTSCQPLEKTCPDNPALGTTYNASWDRTSTELGKQFWDVVGNDYITFGSNGADLTLSRTGQSVTANSTFYIMWGSAEIIMRAASGQGIISTIVLLSADLDEIDIEIIGSNHSTISTNWYGHGDRNQSNGMYHPVSGAQDGFHNYTVVWGQDKTTWYVDGNVIRELAYARSGMYPQTPSNLLFGVWAAGDKGQPEGQVQWAGGSTDWSKGPFTMSVKSIKITDGTTNVTSYTYTDKSGSYSSIRANPGESKAYSVIHKQSKSQKAAASWNGLSKGAKIGIIAGVVSVIFIATVAFCIFCFRQRKQGRAERAAADAAWNAQQAEMMSYRTTGRNGGYGRLNDAHGEKF